MHNLQLVRRTSIAAGAAASLLLALAPVASAGTDPLTIDPASGPAGTTTINVSAMYNCFPGDSLEVNLTPGYTGEPYAGSGMPIAGVAANLTDAEHGSWIAQLPVPASAAVGPYTVDARCTYHGAEQVGRGQRAQQAGFSYDPMEFQVTPDEATTTTTIAVTTTTVPATTTTVAPPAAQAVRARPTYTG